MKLSNHAKVRYHKLISFKTMLNNLKAKTGALRLKIRIFKIMKNRILPLRIKLPYLIYNQMFYRVHLNLKIKIKKFIIKLFKF